MGTKAFNHRGRKLFVIGEVFLNPRELSDANYCVGPSYGQPLPMTMCVECMCAMRLSFALGTQYCLTPDLVENKIEGKIFDKEVGKAP